MTTDERSRHELHTRLTDVLGSEAATTLMSYLPPVGWADVATKRDVDAIELRIETLESRFDDKLDVLGSRFDDKLDALESRINASLERALNSQSKTLFFSLAGLMLTLAAIALGALQLA